MSPEAKNIEIQTGEQLNTSISSGPTDPENIRRMERACKVKRLANALTPVYARIIQNVGNLNNGDPEVYARSVLEEGFSNKREAGQFVKTVQTLTGDYWEMCNVGSNESDIALATRRLFLISHFIRFSRNHDIDIDGKTVVKITDAFLTGMPLIDPDNLDF